MDGFVVTSLALFALNATADLGGAVARELWVSLAPHEEREFEDGEHKARPLESVEGADAYVIQSLHSGPSESAADKLVRLLFFIGALKDAGAARVTAVTPYLSYAARFAPPVSGEMTASGRSTRRLAWRSRRCWRRSSADCMPGAALSTCSSSEHGIEPLRIGRDQPQIGPRLRGPFF